ncbi:hypothetical protein [Telluribacter humicola]|uniref:hypothetical protein n=1 Tax=Telluribacter humicola TaxID=1720261 RepID=UPI001A977B74|nr:hypothetical protein [Telluribacter humicola]
MKFVPSKKTSAAIIYMNKMNCPTARPTPVVLSTNPLVKFDHTTIINSVALTLTIVLAVLLILYT